MKKVITKKKISFVLSLILALSTVLCVLGTGTKIALAEYGWESAFYNDIDGDGDTELLPYIYTGTSTIAREYYYNINTSVPYDSEKYGGPTAEDDEKWDEDYTYLCETYDIDPYDEYETLLAEKFGEGTEKYLSAKKEYDDFYKFDEEYNEKYTKAYNLWNADKNDFKSKHPEIEFGHTVDDSLTKTTTKNDETLFYWLHIPYNYNPEKSYPVFVLANGEWSTWTKSTYLDNDGNYKSEKLDPPDSYQLSTIMSSWYNLVKTPGENREKYDCFFIYILNTNEFFRGDGGIGIVNQYNDNDIQDARNLTSDDTGDTSYKAIYSRTYVADEISPAYQEQLVCQLIDDLATKYNLDLTRQYVSGFSLGGIFTMDIISHYPDRFACAVPICTASADITEGNCKALTYTNVWAISGNNDTTCNKYFSKLFVDKINECREKYGTGTNNIAQYSFFTGGHTGGQAQCRAVTATSGVSMTSSTQLMEFIFNSKRSDVNNAELKSTNLQVKDSVSKLVSSSVLSDSDTYDVLLVGSDFVGNYDKKGFVVNVTYSSGETKTKLIVSDGSASTITATIDGKLLTISAEELDALSIHSSTIRNIPKDVVKIELTEYAQNGSGEFYGTSTTYTFNFDGKNVVSTNITECEKHHYVTSTTATCEHDGWKTSTCIRCGYFHTEKDEGGCIWDNETHKCLRNNNSTVQTETLIYSICGNTMAIWANGENKTILKEDIEKVITANISKITIQNGITTIGEGAFENCSSITSVSIPESVLTIEKSAFTGTNIADLVIPVSVLTVDGECFNKDSLKTLKIEGISENTTIIRNFIGYTELETLIIERASELETFAFQGCSKLKNLDLTGVVYCGAVAFQCCTSLTTVWISSTLTGVEPTHTYTNDTGAWIFDGCYNLTDIYVEAPLIPSDFDVGTSAGWYGSTFRRYVNRKTGEDFGTPYLENQSEYYYTYTDLVTTIHWACSKYGDAGTYTTTVHK